MESPAGNIIVLLFWCSIICIQKLIVYRQLATICLDLHLNKEDKEVKY